MTAKLKTRLWAWAGAALVTAATAGVVAPNFLKADTPAEKTEPAAVTLSRQAL